MITTRRLIARNADNKLIVAYDRLRLEGESARAQPDHSVRLKSLIASLSQQGSSTAEKRS